MAALSKGDLYLLERIRRGDGEGWSRLVDRYQGRLLAFARKRMRNADDAEDLVQETFIAFLGGLARYRRQASLETYLFTICRRKIIDHFRGRRLAACLLADGAAADEPTARQVEAPDPTASWYARRDEHAERQQAALADALADLVARHKAAANFRDLKIIELLFYAQLPNRQIAPMVSVKPSQVALIKHRCLDRVRQSIASCATADATEPPADALLTDAWEALRPSCPKRSTIGAYLLGTVDDAWRDYVRFHLEQLGCRFCQANYEDLKQQTAGADRRRVHRRIMESTVGFLRKA